MNLNKTQAQTFVCCMNSSGGRRCAFVLWFAVFLFYTASGGAVTYESATVTPPRPQREFRGAWAATVKNIDWPSKPGLSTAEQKAEMIAMLDRAAKLKLNAIFFQVRPMCDAMYASDLEPWSPYLTGTMGQAPQPFYDPLAFAIAEAHKRGLELHAWFNPYRALVKAPNIRASANHVSKRRPELVRDYGDFLWLDPGEKAVQDHSLEVVLDVVKRYDVDGVHFDDYFYPYPVKGRDGRNADFPDAASWKKSGVGKMSRSDWRRENVNRFVERVYKSIKQMKPRVKFGISPFGIWRPGYPKQIQGLDAYEALYADARKWLVNGWVDYFAPQLYWRIEAAQQSFPVLLKWWTEQNPTGRPLWAGLNTAKTASGNGSWPAGEILNQIKMARRHTGVSGHIHWNAHILLQNQSLVGSLSRDLYAEPALTPAMPWLDSAAPGKPDVRAFNSGGSTKVTWATANGEPVSLWLLQCRRGTKWSSEVLAADARSYFLSDGPEAIALSAVDRAGNLSKPAALVMRR